MGIIHDFNAAYRVISVENKHNLMAMRKNIYYFYALIFLACSFHDANSQSYDFKLQLEKTVEAEVYRREAMESTYRDAIKLGAPTGWMGVMWFMSEGQALDILKKAEAQDPLQYKYLSKNDKQISIVHKTNGRRWIARFNLKNNMVVGFTYNSVDNPSLRDFEIKQKELDGMYSKSGENHSDPAWGFEYAKLTKIGPFRCIHGMKRFEDVNVEQVVLFLDYNN